MQLFELHQLHAWLVLLERTLAAKQPCGGAALADAAAGGGYLAQHPYCRTCSEHHHNTLKQLMAGVPAAAVWLQLCCLLKLLTAGHCHQQPPGSTPGCAGHQPCCCCCCCQVSVQSCSYCLHKLVAETHACVTLALLVLLRLQAMWCCWYWQRHQKSWQKLPPEQLQRAQHRPAACCSIP